MKTFIILGTFLLCTSLHADNNPSLNYIALYKHIAISEMQRTGIPASIKLAQGLLESGAGKSTLAVEANNHFGIKCGGMWQGETFYREDDDHNADGKLIASCFRKFADPTESYFEHSVFLTDQKRYAFLFDYGRYDYKSWAYGLKKAGYATDKSYPTKLINIIEKYHLYAYDHGTTDDLLVINEEKSPEQKMYQKDAHTEQEVFASKTYKSPPKSSTPQTQKRRNKRKKEGSHKSASEKIFHIVQEGENMADIAMSYDMDETMMRLRNRIPKDAEPLTGEKVYLRKKINVFSRPEFRRAPENGDLAVEDEYIF